MPNDYSFELDHLTFSFSSLSAYHTCKYSFKLQYIDVEPRQQNFFGEYGSFIHKIMEFYWQGELPKEEMANYFEAVYNDIMKTPPPSFPEGMEEKYYNDALEFLRNFPYDRDDYDVIATEGKYNTEYKGISIVVRPDLILRDKRTGEIVMLDFKTSKPVKGKKQAWDEAKIAEYVKQTLLYAHFYQVVTGMKVNRIKLLFVRLNREYVVEVTEESIQPVLEWLEKTVQLIKWEDDFEPTVDNYFCSQICSVRDACKYWREVVFKDEYIPE